MNEVKGDLVDIRAVMGLAELICLVLMWIELCLAYYTHSLVEEWDTVESSSKWL